MPDTTPPFPKFPKVFRLDANPVQRFIDQPVIIKEKLDGSQFSFGYISDHGLVCRSKNQVIHGDTVPLFSEAVRYVQSIEDTLRGLEDMVFYCEYLKKPRHNVLTYDRVPKNHLMLFGVSNDRGRDLSVSHHTLMNYAQELDIDYAPMAGGYEWEVNEPVPRPFTIDEVEKLLGTESYLGREIIEGVVMYHDREWYWSAADVTYPIVAVKVVRQEFRERHKNTWTGTHTVKGGWDVYKESFATPARWEKAVQHLRDDGRLEGEPRDIAALIKEVHRDITEECREDILADLWRMYSSELLKASTRGMPEWYREKIGK